MKFSVFLLSLAGVALAKNKTSSGTSTKSQCREIAKLTAMVNLASNTTKLEHKAKNNETKVEAIQAQASAAATKLTTLESNATLVSTCNQMFAVAAMEDDCAAMIKFEKLVALAANTTELDSKTKNNATKASAIQAKASVAATKLAALQSNTTLTQFCSVQDSLAQCDTLSQLQKTVDKNSNTTALEAKFGANSAKVTAAQAKAAKAQTKLAALASNTTLVDFCSSAGISVEAAAASSTATATSSSSSSTSTGTTSAAVRVGSSSLVGSLAFFSALFAAACMI